MNGTVTRPTLWGREPVAIVGAVEAVILLAIGFGLDVTGEQVALINTALMAVLALAVRQSVTPTAKVVEQLTLEGEVVAGPANNMVEPGASIRKVQLAKKPKN